MGVYFREPQASCENYSRPHLANAAVWAEGEGEMIGRLGEVLYWCGLAIASLCEIAAFVAIALIIANRAASDAWLAVVFFAVVGALTWLVGRSAKYVLTGN
jgi:hypothetical protein